MIDRQWSNFIQYALRLCSEDCRFVRKKIALYLDWEFENVYQCKKMFRLIYF
jgi:hypothetical protein